MTMTGEHDVVSEPDDVFAAAETSASGELDQGSLMALVLSRTSSVPSSLRLTSWWLGDKPPDDRSEIADLHVVSQ